MLGKQITVYGDGNQVRDVLHVSDLVNAYDLAIQRAECISGKVFNVGGGPRFTLSLNELIDLLRKHLGVPIQPESAPGVQVISACTCPISERSRMNLAGGHPFLLLMG